MKFLGQLSRNRVALWVVIGLLTLGLPTIVFANVIMDGILGMLSQIFYFVFIFILGWALALVTQVLVWVMSYSDFGSEAIVIKGWTILRNLSNMFFIIILVVVAIGTIVKSGRYGYQQNLRRLILMAILINFSKTITLFFIDLSQVVTISFVNSFLDSIQDGFPKLLGLTGMLSLQSGGPDLPKEGILAVFLQIALGGIMLLVATIVVSVITFMFLMRIIIFVFLIILSPIAFLCSTLPTAKKYYDEWWDELGKYLVVGPVLAFFLWLSFAVVQIGGEGALSKTISGSTTSVDLKDSAFTESSASRPAATTAPNDPGANTIAGSLQRFFVAIALLFGSLMMAGRLGTVGSGLAKQASGKLTGMGQAALVGVARRATVLPARLVAGGLDKVQQGSNFLTNKVASGAGRLAETITFNKTGGRAGRAVTNATRATIQGAGAVLGSTSFIPLHKAARGLNRYNSSQKAKDIDDKKKAMSHDSQNTKTIALNSGGRVAQAAAAVMTKDGSFKKGKNSEHVDAAHDALVAGGESTREEREKFELENWSRIDRGNTTSTKRDEIAARAIKNGDQDKLIQNIDPDTFGDMGADMQRAIIEEFEKNGGTNDDLEKGVRRWAKAQQATFAHAYADAYSNNDASLAMMARLDASGFISRVNSTASLGFSHPGVRNAVSSLSGEQLVKLDRADIERLAPHMNANQVKAVGERGTLDLQNAVIEHANPADGRVVKQIMESDSYAAARIAPTASGTANLTTLGAAWTTIVAANDAYIAGQSAVHHYHAEVGKRAAKGKAPRTGTTLPIVTPKPEVRPNP